MSRRTTRDSAPTMRDRPIVRRRKAAGRERVPVGGEGGLDRGDAAAAARDRLLLELVAGLDRGPLLERQEQDAAQDCLVVVRQRQHLRYRALNAVGERRQIGVPPVWFPRVRESSVDGLLDQRALRRKVAIGSRPRHPGRLGRVGDRRDLALAQQFARALHDGQAGPFALVGARIAGD